MTVHYQWFLPTEGEDRRRPPQDPTAAPQHWIDVARAAEYAGFHALQVPSGIHRPDAWLVAATLARATRHLSFVVALRPGFVLPPAAAQWAQTFDELSRQRVAFSLLVGGDSAEHRTYGDLVNHDDRFARAAEFIHLVKQSWKGRSGALGFHHRGAHYRVENAGLLQPLRTPPRLHVGGHGPSVESIAAAHADVFVSWGEPLEAMHVRIARVRALAAAHGRTLRIACRLHVFADETGARAWRDADAALRAAWHGPGAAPEAREFGDGEAGPLWRGVGVLRGRTLRGQPRWEDGAGLVGSYRDVAEHLGRLQAAGVQSFVLSGERGLEDALRFGEELLPLVRGATPRTASMPVPVPAAVPVPGASAAPAPPDMEASAP